MKRFYSALSVLVFVAAIIFLAGCGGTTPVSSEATTTNAASANPYAGMNALPASDAKMVWVTFKASGDTKGITGTYTDASGLDVSIPATVAATETQPAFRALPWESTVQYPKEVGLRQPIRVSATDAFGNNATITVEIWSQGQLVATQSGTNPTATVPTY